MRGATQLTQAIGTAWRFGDWCSPSSRAEHNVLDFGAGSGVVGEMDFRGIARSVTGVDPDPRVLENPMCGYSDCSRWLAAPLFDDRSFDVVVAYNVLGNICRRQPAPFCEIRRVLRPGGYFLLQDAESLTLRSSVICIDTAWISQVVQQATGKGGVGHVSRLTTAPTLGVALIACTRSAAAYSRLALGD